MATFAYIVISDSTASKVKRFKAIKMSMPKQRTDSMQITASGAVDIAAGVILQYLQYTLKVPEESADSLYGTRLDLDYFFMLNNPAGSPSNLLTLVDHYGDTFTVAFKEDVAPSPITTQLEGNNAIYYIPVKFIKILQPQGSGSGGGS